MWVTTINEESPTLSCQGLIRGRLPTLPLNRTISRGTTPMTLRKREERISPYMKSPRHCRVRDSLGGGYLLSHFRSTIGVVRLNFSVRNGKRWNPHAITTLMSFSRL